jgi:hypothetical protein
MLWVIRVNFNNASIMLLWSVLLVKATTDLQEVFVSSTPLHKRKSKWKTNYGTGKKTR